MIQKYLCVTGVTLPSNPKIPFYRIHFSAQEASHVHWSGQQGQEVVQ